MKGFTGCMERIDGVKACWRVERARCLQSICLVQALSPYSPQVKNSSF